MIKRKILVTGANKGIGLALVRELARRADCQIIMAFRKGNNGVDEFNNLKKEFSKADIHYFLVDITKSECKLALGFRARTASQLHQRIIQDTGHSSQ